MNRPDLPIHSLSDGIDPTIRPPATRPVLKEPSILDLVLVSGRILEEPDTDALKLRASSMLVRIQA